MAFSKLKKSLSRKKSKKGAEEVSQVPVKHAAPEHIEDADTVGGSTAESFQMPEDSVKVEVPAGRLGLSFKKNPPEITHIADDSPLAGSVKVGQKILGVTNPGNKGCFNAGSSKLAKYLGETKDSEQRMLIVTSPSVDEEEEREEEAAAPADEDSERTEEEEPPAVPPVAPPQVEDASDDEKSEKKEEESESPEPEAEAEPEKESAPVEPEPVPVPSHQSRSVEDAEEADRYEEKPKEVEEDVLDEQVQKKGYDCCGFKL